MSWFFFIVLYYIINSFVTTEGVEDAQVIIIRIFLFNLNVDFA